MDTTDRPEVSTAPRHRRTIAITGSGSGIGAAVSRRFERSGLRVIGIDVHDAQVIADLSGPAGRAQALATVAELSGSRLDGLVVCAGLGPQVQPTEMIARVNFFGAVDVLDGLLPLLTEGEASAAVVVSSNSASLTPAHEELLGLFLDGDEEKTCACAAGVDGATVYGMSKLALTRALRRRARRMGEGRGQAERGGSGPRGHAAFGGRARRPCARTAHRGAPGAHGTPGHCRRDRGRYRVPPRSRQQLHPRFCALCRRRERRAPPARQSLRLDSGRHRPVIHCLNRRRCSGGTGRACVPIGGACR